MEITRIENLTLAYVNSFVLKCAVDLNIPGHIQAYGRPVPLNELARSIPIPPEKDSMLGRLMALLFHQGIFMQTEEGYLLTPVSELILINGSNMGAFVHGTTNAEFLKSWGRLSEVFTDTGTCTLFQKAFDGKQFWEIIKERPDIGNIFKEAMATHSEPKMRGLVATYPHIFDGLQNLVDVGGGTGTSVKIIAEAFPGLRCIVFDLPHVVAEIQKNDFFDVVGGDMFEKIPPADAIFLKNVLHNWNHEDCIRILKRCKEAIESGNSNGGKVIVMEIIIDLKSKDTKAVETSLLFDIQMMCCFNTKERQLQLLLCMSKRRLVSIAFVSLLFKSMMISMTMTLPPLLLPDSIASLHRLSIRTQSSWFQS